MSVDLSAVNASTTNLPFKLRRFARFLAGRDREERTHAKEFEADQRDGRIVRRAHSIQDHYDEPVDVAQFHKAKASFAGGGREIVPARLRISKATIDRLLRSDNGIRSVIDFGCHYGWLGSEIARENPHITVISTDRHEQMQALNRQEFRLPNLMFPAVPDLMELTRAEPRYFRDAIFTHTYTTMFLLPLAVRQIYSALHNSGTRYILAHEQLGFSRNRLRQYRFSYQPRPSMWHRDGILLHNYPEILQSAGFTVIEATAHKVPVPHTDWRSAVFVGRMSDA
jgi:hypothetical protein